MTYEVVFANATDKVISKWKKSNPNLYKKFVKVMLELQRHPKEGLGHPEPLVGMGGITWSRRISAHDRLIYDIHDDTITVIIIQVEGHYKDK